MRIIKIIFFLFFIFFSIFIYVNANNIIFQQGFTNFYIKEGKINFNCINECIIGIDKLKEYKKIKISGQITGNGKIGIGYIIGNKLIILSFKEILNKNKIFYLTDSPYYNNLPKNTIISLILIGNIKGKNIKIELYKNVGLKKNLQDFFKIEGITPYIINIHYGGKLFGIPEVKLLTFIGLFGIIIIFFLSQKSKYKKIIYFLIILTSLIALKNLTEYIIVTIKNINNYYHRDKVFYLNDYYHFIKDIRKLIKFDNQCTYDIISYRSWPFISWTKAIYMKPCKYEKNNPKYILVYKTKISLTNSTCKILYSKKNNLLLKCK